MRLREREKGECKKKQNVSGGQACLLLLEQLELLASRCVKAPFSLRYSQWQSPWFRLH